MADNLLEVRTLEVGYNRVAAAIQGVSLEVPNCSIVALVGTNGAGKTTTLRAISGFLPFEDAEITDGEIMLAGRRIDGELPHQLARAGVILVPQREKVFATLSVQENLAFAPRQAADITRERAVRYFPPLAQRPAQLARAPCRGGNTELAIRGARVGRPP